MALGSFSTGALIDLEQADVERMLALDETLFVEHKKSLNSESAYKVAQAIAAFANTAGGWLLIGVKDGQVVDEAASWATEAPTFVDALRSHLILQLEPLPAFEARVIEVSDLPVGVVRVYESADAPHVMVQSGAVFIREVAGVSDATTPTQPGAGSRARRRYEAAKISSRAQLVELLDRSRRARERVSALLELRHNRLPLTAGGLGLTHELVMNTTGEPNAHEKGRVIVRLAPHTIPPRFRGWATTAEGGEAVLAAAEALSGWRGLAASFITPDPAGATVSTDAAPADHHHDGAGLALGASARIMLDGAGVAGAALELDRPSGSHMRRSRRKIEELITPVLSAAASVLSAAEVLGRATCQIDLVDLPVAVVPAAVTNNEARMWLPVTTEVTLPLDDATMADIALRASNAYSRSAGLPMWDAPASADGAGSSSGSDG